MQRKVQPLPHHKQTAFMRSSVLELNRSMASIEKMIERTRKLISSSKGRRVQGQGQSRVEEESAGKAIGSIECSVRRVGGNNKSSDKPGVWRSPKEMRDDNRQSKLYKEDGTKQINAVKGGKQNVKIPSTLRQYSRNPPSCKTASPSSSIHYSQRQSKQKATNNPEKYSKIIHTQSAAKKTIKKKIFLNTQNILIEDAATSRQQRSNHHYRYKTEQSPINETNEGTITFRIAQNLTTKPKITLKTQEGGKKSQMTSHWSNKSTFQSLRVAARQDLVDELARLETHSSSEAERRDKFILKIKKYGFVERHLTETEIWKMYDQLVQQAIPEIQWPIAIVQAVYSRMATPV